MRGLSLLVLMRRLVRRLLIRVRLRVVFMTRRVTVKSRVARLKLRLTPRLNMFVFLDCLILLWWRRKLPTGVRLTVPPRSVGLWVVFLVQRTRNRLRLLSVIAWLPPVVALIGITLLFLLRLLTGLPRLVFLSVRVILISLLI